MPPRFAYWTILIDNTPTAFRAREREELQPTLVQLQRKNANVTMLWFARGKLWESREAEREDFQMSKHAPLPPRDRGAERPRDVERPQSATRRGSDWRPGGAHKDPRDRFKKKNRPERAWSEKDPATQRDSDKPGWKPKPWAGKPSGPPRERKPWTNKPAASSPPNDRPWQTKPTGPRAQRKPWVPAGAARKPWENKPAGGPPRGDRPWSAKPAGERKPWSGKPRDPNRKPFVPRKRRDDDPDKD